MTESEFAALGSQAEVARAADEVVKTAILEQRKQTTTQEVVAKLTERQAMRTAFAVKL